MDKHTETNKDSTCRDAKLETLTSKNITFTRTCVLGTYVYIGSLHICGCMCSPWLRITKAYSGLDYAENSN